MKAMKLKKRLKLALIAALALVGGNVAFAQQPAPPSPDEAPTPVEVAPGSPNGVNGAKAEGKAESEVEAPPAVDDSRYMNWFDLGYGKKDYYGGPLGDGKMNFSDVKGLAKEEQGEEEKMSPPFLFMLINFALLLFILNKYGAPAARKLAEERHDLIKNALHEAADLRSKAEAKLKEYEAKLGQADVEIKKLVDGLRTDAEADKQRILAAAETQAALMKRDAELRIAAEIETARAKLTREVTLAATAATEKLLRDKATADDQAKLVGAFIAGVQPTAIRSGSQS